MLRMACVRLFPYNQTSVHDVLLLSGGATPGPAGARAPAENAVPPAGAPAGE